MLWLWQLRLKRWRIEHHYASQLRELQRKKASRDDFNEIESSEYADLRDVDETIEYTRAIRLWREATALDIELPALTDNKLWKHSEDGEVVYLTSAGRALARRLIAEEKARQFEVKTLWVMKFWLPLLASIVGIIGAVTGLVAVLHKK